MVTTCLLRSYVGVGVGGSEGRRGGIREGEKLRMINSPRPDSVSALQNPCREGGCSSVVGENYNLHE